MPAPRPPPPGGPQRLRGFTLVEVTAVVAVVGIVAAMAWPSHLGQLQRARRLDATAALTKLQFAQERYRARFGIYSNDLAALAGSAQARSGEGLYDLVVRDGIGEAVTLAARARDDQAQNRDAECREITLHLNQGLADQGPSGRCWNQ
jgi:type IV pilus assembly protein PilE